MSQQEVADLLNIDKSYLSLIEHGKRRPGRDLVLMLADRAYALPLGEIDQLLLSAEYAPLRYRHGTDHMPRAVEADTGARPGNT
jgi:transcriptional regulator with XRE-family HTH domain